MIVGLIGLWSTIANSNQETHDYKHLFYIGFYCAHYNYREPDVMQDVDYNLYGARWAKDVGDMWGGSAFYRLTYKQNLFFQPELSLLYGKNQYNWGQKKRIVSKTNHSIPSLIFEPRLTIGWNFSVHKSVTVSPYSGIGYRFKSDDSDDVKCNDGDKLGFYRKSNYVYMPLGTSVEYVLTDNWSISLKGEYDWIVKAWHIDRSMGDPTLSFKQPNGYGLKSEASVEYLHNKVKFYLTPYINYWNIRNSKREYFMHDGYKSSSREPYNITWETGLKLGVSF
jgi:hypothetical protein